MTTFYLDYEGGNDANAGTSFATRWKTITGGATAARIAPGDTIRIMASPDPTSLGSATWTGGGRPASANVSSSTNATPIVITQSSHPFTAGDYVAISGHATNTNANGVWKVGTTTSTTYQILQMDGTNTTGNGVGSGGTATKVNNCVVKLAATKTQNIALCGGLGQKPAWTASANVTTSQVTTTGLFKEGYSSAQIAVAAAFTTGMAAYYTLPATLNLSTYQQVSFWIRQTTGTIGAAGAAYIALCSDTLGATVVNTCNIPALGITSQWVPVTVNLGTNLGSSIRSVALYIVTDNGAQTFQIDNIIACKASSSADSISLTSLISKSDGTGDEGWYAVQSINYDVVMLANANNIDSTNSQLRGYNGASGSVTTYKRDTIKTAIATTGTAVIQEFQASGAAGNLINFSGGWNRTDMSTQTGQTWFDGQNNAGSGIYSGATVGYVGLDRVNFCRYDTGLLLSGSGVGFAVANLYGTACGSYPVYVGVNNSTVSNLWANNNGFGVLFQARGNVISTIKTAENCSTSGVSFSSGAFSNVVGSALVGNSSNGNNGGVTFSSGATNNVVTSLTSVNSNYAVSCTASAGYVNGGSSTGSLTAAVYGGNGANLYLNNFVINEATEVAYGTVASVYSNRHDDTDGNNWVFTDAGTVNQQTSVVDSPATTSWKMNPTGAYTSATAPLRLKIGTVVCAAGSLVTVTARMRRSDTGLTMQLACPGGQIVGVASDVTSSMTAAANTWETVTITFTPTKAGAVDIYAYAFGGTTYSGYVCNLGASQA